MPSFFIDPTERVGNEITLTGDLHRHLTQSLRTKVGDSLLLTEAAVQRHTARVTQIDRRQIRVQIESTIPCPPQSSVQVCLASAILKHDPMDWAVQKATELGVSAIQPLITHRSAVRPDAERGAAQRARWERIAQEAAQQSERWTIPAIADPMTLTQWLARMGTREDPTNLSIVLEERRSAQSLLSLPFPPKLQTVTILIGPEGGWEPSESDGLLARGVQPASLGETILRADTAAVTALAIVQARVNWGNGRAG
ncbi:MAG: 16S rRNA (uracil(1498)-N(3))-methyltransferase [Nitrospiraceae bacterium]